MLFAPHPASGPSSVAYTVYARPAAPHDDLSDEGPDGEGPYDETDDTGAAVTPDFETAPSRTGAGDGDSSAA
jgi:hypothetical protein